MLVLPFFIFCCEHLRRDVHYWIWLLLNVAADDGGIWDKSDVPKAADRHRWAPMDDGFLQAGRTRRSSPVLRSAKGGDWVISPAATNANSHWLALVFRGDFFIGGTKGSHERADFALFQ